MQNLTQQSLKFRCRRLGNSNEIVFIAVPAPFIVFHKVGAGDIDIEEQLKICAVSASNIYAEYFH